MICVRAPNEVEHPREEQRDPVVTVGDCESKLVSSEN